MNPQDAPRTPCTTLPATLRPLFWDYDVATLTWETDRDLIIARILAAGDWEAVMWLRSRLGDGPLREWLERHQGRGLSPPRLRFWEVILAIPPHQVNAWLAAEERKIWDQRVHR
jgi:hypothetical protein